MASKATLAILAEQREESLGIMRGYVQPGDTVYTILRHVSASGMLRVIGVYVVSTDGARAYPYDVTHLVARIIDLPIHAKHYGVTVGGAGMDMGYHVVYSLSRAMWPDGVPCTGKADRPDPCPSNEHNNGDREYSAHKIHADGGYALRHRWL